ncbi:hypothetical protein B0T20DRAFT_111331 [Sordaria brevicollis]|uniref:WSC domain-containing protein n=1 Tax=Sordaria brevicollis TaxID=83679 RepID=A0AAE0U0H8_SORBR|nr:hypothetical protein B0T20DRAFT_111331 [Sordaria brevicollis]
MNPQVGVDCTGWKEDNTEYCISSWTSMSEISPLFLRYNFLSCLQSGSLDVKITVGVNKGGATPKDDGGEDNMTIEKCTLACREKSYEFAGLQNGDECWCGNYAGLPFNNETASVDPLWPAAEDMDWNPQSITTNFAQCSTPCSGDETEICGGKNLLAVFRTGDGFREGTAQDVIDECAEATGSKSVGTPTETGTSAAATSTGAGAPGASGSPEVSGAGRRFVAGIVGLALVMGLCL